MGLTYPGITFTSTIALGFVNDILLMTTWFPEKWTTIPDFIKLYRQISHRKYDCIILHAGAVDAAPRHQKTILNTIYPQKKDILDAIFGEEDIQAYYRSDLGCEYEGDKTINMYSLDMAKEKLLPLLRQIPHLIWISSNRIVPGWRGNYWKDRPENINIIEEYSRLFSQELNHQVEIIDLMDWSNNEVQNYTFDNIHPNEKGSDYIFDHLLELVDPPTG